MLTFNFLEKLRKIEPRFFIPQGESDVGDGQTKAKLLCIWKRSKDVVSNWTANYASASAREFVTQTSFDTVCGIPAEDSLPEYDIFFLDTGKLKIRGWRSILKILLNRGLISADKARAVFNRTDLFRTDYDLASFETRLSWARSDSRWSDPDKNLKLFKQAVSQNEVFDSTLLKQLV